MTARWRDWLDLLVAACMIAASVTFVMTALSLRRSASNGKPGPARAPVVEVLPTAPVSLQGAALVGRKDAAFVVIEFSDFQCPYCARFATDSWPGIRAKFIDSGRVLFAFRHLPLSAHPFALQAARMAECGRRQNRFWELHDLFFRDGARLATEALAETAARVGANREQLEGCIQTEGREAVESDVAQAQALGIRGTPTFFFGTSLKDGSVKVLRRQSGALSPDVFSDVVANLQRDRAAK